MLFNRDDRGIIRPVPSSAKNHAVHFHEAQTGRSSINGPLKNPIDNNENTGWGLPDLIIMVPLFINIPLYLYKKKRYDSAEKEKKLKNRVFFLLQ